MAAKTGVRLLSTVWVGRAERGCGLPFVERVPYFPQEARNFLSSFKTAVLLQERAPVPTFGYYDMSEDPNLLRQVPIADYGYWLHLGTGRVGFDSMLRSRASGASGIAAEKSVVEQSFPRQGPRGSVGMLGRARAQG